MGDGLTGARIKALRQRLGISQVELAALLGVSNVTVNRWEHDRAFPQPSTIERLLLMEREGVESLRQPVAARLGNLPPAFAPLVGRATDLEAASSLVPSRPLVTLTGPAGTGKTRLAIETGRATAQRWPDGVWFIDLAAIQEPDAVLHAVARVLGLRETGRKPLVERLEEAMCERTLLLILDNCEHLRAACAELAARILNAGGASRLLATSRVPLGVTGEMVYALRPLATNDAAALFVQRAREHQPGLALDAAQSAAVTEICRRLDGLPLAIELAAARTHVLSVEQIAGRLDQRFDLLRGSDAAVPRQRALDTAIAWSCDLLGPEEAALFRALSVFAGWFDLAAVEAVAGRGHALDLLAGLAWQSMVVVEHDPPSGAARYRLLESLAEYARGWLEDSGETAATGQRHAAYYGALAQDLAGGLRGAKQAALLAILDREHDNLVAALEWTLTQGDVAAATSLVAALGPYWSLRGRYAEGSAWLRRALAQQPAPATPARVAALNQLGLLEYHTSRFDDAERTLSEGVTLSRDLGERGAEARAKDTLGLVQAARRELDQAKSSHQAALAIFQELGDRASAALSTMNLGRLINLGGDQTTADRVYHEAWALVQGTGDTAAEALILSNLGEVAARIGRPERALAYYERTLSLLRVLGDPDRMAVVSTNIAEVRLVLGEAEAALPLASEAVVQFRMIGNPAHLASALYIEAAAQAALGRRQAALTLLRESLALYHQMADWIDIVYVLEAIARILVEGPDAALAARLLGGAEAIREQSRVADYPIFDREGTDAAVQAALGHEAAAELRNEGRRRSPAEVVADGLHLGIIDDGDPIFFLTLQPRAQPLKRRDTALTARQIDVLRLAAEGMSNREIGQHLHISDRTVERHLTSIFGVLGVDRRSAAVARATAMGVLRERGS